MCTRHLFPGFYTLADELYHAWGLMFIHISSYTCCMLYLCVHSLFEDLWVKRGLRVVHKFWPKPVSLLLRCHFCCPFDNHMLYVYTYILIHTYAHTFYLRVLTHSLRVHTYSYIKFGMQVVYSYFMLSFIHHTYILIYIYTHVICCCISMPGKEYWAVCGRREREGREQEGAERTRNERVERYPMHFYVPCARSIPHPIMYIYPHMLSMHVHTSVGTHSQVNSFTLFTWLHSTNKFRHAARQLHIHYPWVCTRARVREYI